MQKVNKMSEHKKMKKINITLNILIKLVNL